MFIACSERDEGDEEGDSDDGAGADSGAEDDEAPRQRQQRQQQPPRQHQQQLGGTEAGPAADGDADPASDSSEDERPNRNTIGAVPLEWYQDEEHIGYDVDGQKLEKKARRDRLEKLIARNDSSKVRAV